MARDAGPGHHGCSLQPGLIMISNHAQFLDAIRDKKKIRIVFYSQPDGGTVDRECAPLDYGPELGAEDSLSRYWIWDYANTVGANPLGLLPGQIVHVHVLGLGFDPAALELGARPWFVLRDWGAHPELNPQAGGPSTVAKQGMPAGSPDAPDSHPGPGLVARRP